MKVEYIDHMGSDLSVVNAARVSFDKESNWQRITFKSDPDIYHEYLSDADKKLISYLAKHNHWSPFAHTCVSLHVKAPIFVARQLGKHQVGLVWNEVSRRYVDTPPEFYIPEKWRKRAENVKQGSSDEIVRSLVPDNLGLSCTPSTAYRDVYEHCLRHYDWMIASGVAPEQARMVLPQAMMTEWIWTGSMLAFHRVHRLRSDAHAQRETQEIAKQIAAIIEPLFPVSWAALGDHT